MRIALACLLYLASQLAMAAPASADDFQIQRTVHVDLNADGIPDKIHRKPCGEPMCTTVWLNVDGKLKKVVSELGGFSVGTRLGRTAVTLTQGHCCGESPMFSTRIYVFDRNAAHLVANYMLNETQYMGDAVTAPYPLDLAHKRFGKVLIDQYNLRFSPSLARLGPDSDYGYGCQNGTNIIAKLNKGARVRILASLQSRDRAWLFVEAKPGALADRCRIFGFEHPEQAVRGWLSGKFVKRLP